jgi:hypothetical protein
MNALVEAVAQRQQEEDLIIDSAMAAEIRREAEQRMYGCTEAELREAVVASGIYKHEGAVVLAQQWISDAQEHLDFVNTNLRPLRQQLNRVKWVLELYKQGK